VTAALIVLASTLAGAIVALVFCLRWAIAAKDGEAKAERALLAEQQAHAATLKERDKLSADLAVTNDRADRELELRLAVEHQRNADQAKERADVEKQVTASNMDDAVRIAADRVQVALPKVSNASTADRDRGAGAVQPAGPPIIDPILTLK
jgi:hypothetical protein